MWDLYNQIDPDMRSGDLVMNLEVDPNSEEIYEVKSGDNLSKIAKKYPGMTWQRIFEANKHVLKSPDLIRPGQKLTIPVDK
ncbi:MAG: LysM peptidoglycan-binding domain-containing protein [Odoribacter sp.]|nr:LysM peptidoglycan-binding domain-containing protein [Odoribacter sp.]